MKQLNERSEQGSYRDKDTNKHVSIELQTQVKAQNQQATRTVSFLQSKTHKNKVRLSSN